MRNRQDIVDDLGSLTAKIESLSAARNQLGATFRFIGLW